MIDAKIPKEFVPFSCAPYALYVNDKSNCPYHTYGVVGVNHAGEYVFFVHDVEHIVAMFCLHALASATDSAQWTRFTPLMLSEIKKHNTDR